MTGRVLVTRRVFPEVTELLRCHFEVEDNPEDRILDAEGLAARLADKEGLFSMATDRIDAALIRRAPRLRAVANCAVGYNNIDVPACRARGIIVTNTPGVLDDTTADHAFALLLAAARRVAESDRWVREGRWKGWVFDDWLGADVHGARLGIVGMGRIGQALARRAAGFSMRVSYHNRKRLPEAVERMFAARYVESLDELVAQADILTLHCPANDDSRGMIDARRIGLMKEGACIINTARGDLIEQEAMIAALESGKLAGAGLDVYPDEPQVDPRLIAHPNVMTLPHIGSATREGREESGLKVIANIRMWVDGHRPPDQVLTGLER